MKQFTVTVCFGKTRVIVPCGEGDLPVSKLTEKAISRYKRAIQRDFIKEVNVRCLQTYPDNGILDRDDLIADVCDDKAMLIAVYDENILNSGSSSFPSQTTNYSPKQEHETNLPSALSDNDSGVAADSYGILSNPPSTHTSLNSSSKPPRGINKRLSPNKNASFRSSASSNSPSSSPEQSRHTVNPVFSRDLNRKSLSTNHPMLYSWIDQQDKYSGMDFYESNNANVDLAHSLDQEEVQLDHHALKSVDIQPYTTADGREIGLVVQNVVEGSYVDRVGELQIADRITTVNGVSLVGLSNRSAKLTFDSALKAEVMRLTRTRSHHFLKDHLSVNSSLKEATVPKPPVKISINSIPKEAAIEAPDSKLKVEETFDDKHSFSINLIKGKDGLGFSITSKDVLTSNSRTFYIKNILGRGAAIADGRLCAGDEILKVNDIPVSDKSQQEIVKMLRQSEGTVALHLSRPKTSADEKPPTSDTIVPLVTSQSCDDSYDHLDSSSQEDTFTLIIPMGKSHSGLGVSVKGKCSEDPKQNMGIYIKSVIKGGAAAEDGRLHAEDRLVCINDTSLLGLSNHDAMNVLRLAMHSSLKKGSISIIVNRSSQSLSLSSNASPISKSPKMNRRKSVDVETDKLFNDTYMGRSGAPQIYYNINRNKSYFKACAPRVTSESDADDTTSLRAVSISSGEIPQMKKSRAVFIDDSPPCYEEAMKRKDTASSNLSQASGGQMKSDGMKFKLPSQLFAVPKGETRKQELKIQGTFFPLNQSKIYSNSQSDLHSNSYDVMRSSVASQSSLDSMMIGPNQIPFTRDAFGRSSMSERKGRAHIDATKSELYNKLKKFKSMEELRGSRVNDDADVFQESMRRSESIDTIISKIDAEEQMEGRFNRGTILSSTYSPEGNKLRSDENKPHKRSMRQLKAINGVKLRTSKSKQRPYSCILDDARARNSVLNDSLKEVLDAPNFDDHVVRTNKSVTLDNRSNITFDDKKRKGFLKGIGGLLRWNKKLKESQRSNSPEYMEAIEKPKNVHWKSNRLSGSLEAIAGMSVHQNNGLMFLQQDELQRELVKKKMQEQKQRKVDKKATTKNNEIETPCELETRKPSEGKKSSHHTWVVHDVESMREKSKQFFPEGRESTRSTRSAQLQRQSSLPPRNNKNSPQVTPTKSPDNSFTCVVISPRSIPVRKQEFYNEHVRSRSDIPSLSEKAQHFYTKQLPGHNPSNFSTLSDLARITRGSVSISHQAEI